MRRKKEHKQFHRFCGLKSCRKPFETNLPQKMYCSTACQYESARLRLREQPDEAPGKVYPRKPWVAMAIFCGVLAPKRD